MDELLIKPKRKLGTGRYDRKLIERMVDLSVADDYEEACKEWIATGNVYWGDIEVPSWWDDRRGKCLCGHKIVYHFEVENTENGEMILVGSDHINSYHILKQIALSTGMQEEMITDEMIDEWMKVRVASMMQTAWWHKHGEHFTEMFEAVKEYDVRVNVRVLKWEYSAKLGTRRPVTAIRKAGKGNYGEEGHTMASIVWRWNHPDNPKAQINTRGYPTEKLWQDLVMFNLRIEEYMQQCEKEDIQLGVLMSLKEKRESLRTAQYAMLREDKDRLKREMFSKVCEYYGLPDFYDTPTENMTTWEKDFIRNMKSRISQSGGHIPHLSTNQMKTLDKIIKGEDTPSTYKQQRYLVRLGYEGEVEELGQKEASNIIDNILALGGKPEY